MRLTAFVAKEICALTALLDADVGRRIEQGGKDGADITLQTLLQHRRQIVPLLGSSFVSEHSRRMLDQVHP